jgi:hypothetical protein
MQISDLQSDDVHVASEDELLRRLRTVRKGERGAFILAYDGAGPLLFVHISGGLAYVHYFDDLSGENAGCQPTGMTPPCCPEKVQFLMTDGSEGSAIEMPDSTVCSVDLAYRAASEFFRDPAKPPSIDWLAL